jgi:hypothetical protein
MSFARLQGQYKEHQHHDGSLVRPRLLGMMMMMHGHSVWAQYYFLQNYETAWLH